MDLNTFKALSEEEANDSLGHLLLALWKAGNGDWEGAHDIVQDDPGADAAWIHAYLHRAEGDPGNAAYWYRRAGKPVAREQLNLEWEAIVTALL